MPNCMLKAGLMVVLAGVLALSTCAVGLAQGPPYAVVILQPTGFDGSQVWGVADGQQVGFAWDRWSGSEHAMLWTGTAESAVDLHPAGFNDSIAWAVAGGQQVGEAWVLDDAGRHAMLWTGTAGSAVDLHPAGFESSYAYGVADGQQVGEAWVTDYSDAHAMLWTGTAESAVDLHPAGFDGSSAQGAADGQQVGLAWATDYLDPHAMLWTGTAESAVDLHPAGCVASGALGVAGGQQVGAAGGSATSGQIHAMLWSGTAESAVDLHPAGFESSYAAGVAGGQQVGEASGHAMLWSGTAESAVDLHQFLGPAGVCEPQSTATGIDAAGNIVGYAFSSCSTVPVMWVPLWFEETHPAIAYAGGWGSYSDARCSGGALAYSAQTGARAEFSFTGTGIRWVTAKAPMLGKANVYLDGAYVGMVDLYSFTPQFQVVLEKTGLAPGPHTGAIEVSGKKRWIATDTIITIDALEVIP